MTEHNTDPLDRVIQRKKVLKYFVLVWVLSCLLIVGYATMVNWLDGTPNWLDLMVFSGWVIVSGVSFPFMPVNLSLRWRRFFWWFGVAILLLVLVEVVIPWFSYTTSPIFANYSIREIYDQTSSLWLRIPLFLNIWIWEVMDAYLAADLTASIIWQSLLVVIGAGLLLTALSILLHIVYRGLGSYFRRFFRWVANQWRRLEQIRVWLWFKWLLIGGTLFTIALIVFGLLFTAQPIRATKQDSIITKGFPAGPPLDVQELIISPDGQSLFVAILDKGVYRSDDLGETWQPVNQGLNSLNVGSLVVGPDNQSIFSWTSDAGIFRSDDLGETWQPVNQGLNTVNIRTLVVGPNGQSLFVAATGEGIYRSDDLGETWELVNQGLNMADVRTLVKGPDGQSLFAVTFSTETISEGIYRSDDLGETWQPVSQGLNNPKVRTLVAGPARHNLVITTMGGEVFSSDDLGETWQAVNQGPNSPNVSPLVMGPDGQSLFAVTSGAGIFRSNDLGETWQPVNPWLSSPNPRNLLVGPDGQSLFVVTSGAGIFRSDDLGEAWQPVNQGLVDINVNDLIVDPYRQSLLVSTSSAGIFHSDDLGETWQPVNEGLNYPNLDNLLLGPYGQSLFALTDGLIFRSDDLGKTWQLVYQGLSGLDVETLVVGPDGQSLFATTSVEEMVLGPDDQSFATTSAKGIFRSDDLGETWEVVNQGLTSLDVRSLVVGPDNKSLFALTWGNEVFRSDNLGEIWQPVNQGLTSLDVSSFVVGPDNKSLFVVSFADGIFRSDDLGESWQAVNQGLSSLDVSSLVVGPEIKSLFAVTWGNEVFHSDNLGEAWQAVNQGLSSLRVTDLIAGPDGQSLFALTLRDGIFRLDDSKGWQKINQGLSTLSASTLVLGPDGKCLFAGTNGAGIFRSDDQGETWQAVNQGLSSLWVTDLIVDPDGQSLIVATVGDGIFRSENLGETWQPINEGLSDLDVGAIVLGPDGQSLFAATYEGGIFRTDNLGETWQSGGSRLSFWPSRSLLETNGQRITKRIQLFRPGMRYSLPWSNAISETQVSIVDKDKHIVTLISLLGSAQLIRQEIPLPLIWDLPTPYLNLIDASWQGIYWFGDNRFPLLLVFSLAVGFMAVYVYSGIVRPNRLSLGLTMWLLPRRRHLFAAASYHSYKSRWTSLPPLEQFVWLFAQQNHSLEFGDTSHDFRQVGVACDQTEVDLALGTLSRQGILYKETGSWRLVDPLLADLLIHDLPPTTLTDLAETIRIQNPLYKETQYFLVEADFSLVSQGDFGFLATSNHSLWQGISPFYVHILLERELDLGVVQDILLAAKSFGDQAGDRAIALAAIDRAPKAGDLYQIFATRAQTGLTIIPLPRSLMRQARIDENVHSSLNSQINLYTGQEDIYNVKTAVSDVLSFFGRHTLLASLEKRLTSGHSIMVYGVRKIGKSSLMHRLREECKWPTAIVDAEGFNIGIQNVLSEAVHYWQAAIETEYSHLTLPEWSINEVGNDLAAQIQLFRRATSEMLTSLANEPGKPGLLFFIDEMEYLYKKGSDDVFFDLASILRGVAEGTQWRGRFALLIAGLDPALNRTDYLDGNRNPFYEFFEPVKLGPLELQDAQTMIISLGGQMGISFDQEALEYLVEMGGGHPFLTRQLCHYAIDKRQERPLKINIVEAKRATNSYLQEPDNYLAKSLWESDGESSDDHEVAILTMLAENVFCVEEELVPPKSDNKKQREALSRLEGLSLIEQDKESSRWYLTIPLYRKWIRHTIRNRLGGYDET